MKRFLLFLLVIPFFLISCTTGVKIDYLAPSEVDMSSFGTVGIASCVPVSDMKSLTPFVRSTDGFHDFEVGCVSSFNKKYFIDATADYVTKAFEDTLSGTKYFNIIDHNITDAIIAASKNGLDISWMLDKYNVDAIIIPKIVSSHVDEAVEVDEYIRRVKNSSGGYDDVINYKYILYQTVSMSITYTIIDTRTMEIYSIKNLSGSKKESTSATVYIKFAKDPVYIAKRLIDSFENRIIEQLVPHKKTEKFTLVKNEPKLKEAKLAYKLVKDDTQVARNEFMRLYEQYSHLPSGINAAILDARLGNIDSAIDLLEKIYKESADSRVLELIVSMKGLRSQNEIAYRQLEKLGTNNKENIFAMVMDN
ncbi:MAG: hypothetical protein K6G51_05805 [Sphaerochaetaceae bacterium]|nr:hypothetical protein [Sphaerochaetaceae bacterium]